MPSVGRVEKRRIMTTVTVKAAWDDEAQVWYVKESTLPGLHLEADTPIELYGKLPGAIEDLLEGTGMQEVFFDFIATGRVKIAA
jgi:hypothetical protein